VAIGVSLFPVVSMLVLFFIGETLKRIYTLIGLTIAFALVLKIAGAEAIEIFSVTAA